MWTQKDSDNLQRIADAVERWPGRERGQAAALARARSDPNHGAVVAGQQRELEAYLVALGKPATNATIAKATGIPTSTVSTRLHALERMGRVKRVAGVRTEIWYPA